MSYQPKPLYMPWNEEAFQADIEVRMMSRAEQNAYRCLLQSLFWQSSRPYVANNCQILQKSANCETAREWKRVRRAVLNKFRLIEVDGKQYWENPRATRDWDRIQQERARMSDLGKRSADVQRTFNRCSTSVEPEKRSEVKRSEEKRSKENQPPTGGGQEKISFDRLQKVWTLCDVEPRALPRTGFSKIQDLNLSPVLLEKAFELWIQDRYVSAETTNPIHSPLSLFVAEVDVYAPKISS